MTDYTPEQWKRIAQKAAAALAQNPHDHEAFQWVSRAREQMHASLPALNAEMQRKNAVDRAEAGRNSGLNAVQDQVQSGLLGLSQAATAGFGDEISGDIAGARNAIASARANHPAAYWGGEGVGMLGTAGASGASATRSLVRPGAGVVERILARIVGPAATGAATVGVQAGGRSEGSLMERVPAMEQGALTGAAMGAALPIAGAVAKTGTKIPVRIAKDFFRNLAGKGTPAAERVAADVPLTLDYYNPTAPPVGGQAAQNARLNALDAFKAARAAQAPAVPSAPSPVKTDIEQLLASLKAGPKAPAPIPADRAAAAGASDLLPQDFYGSTWHLRTLLKEGNVTPEYAAALRRELARRAAP